MDKKVANTQEQQQPEVSDGGIQSCLSIRDKSESETSQTDKKLSDSVGVDSSRLKDKDKSADDEIIEIDKTFNENICEDFGYDEKLNSLKVISEGHGTLKTDLQIALFDLAEKEGQQKDFEEDEIRQQEKTWLLEERIRLMTEKIACIQHCLERKEKKQEIILMEVTELQWKFQDAESILEQSEKAYGEMQSKVQLSKEELSSFDSQVEQAQQQLLEETDHLTNLSKLLQQGDPQTCAIKNGERLKELEERRQSLNEALDAGTSYIESLYIEIDEKSERIQRLRNSFETTKKQKQQFLKDRKNHYAYLAETDLRLQRSLDYLLSKTDYGIYKPAPWPDVRENLRFKM